MININTVITIVTVTGAIVGIGAGILAIRRHFRPLNRPRIVSPPTQSENAGRYLTVQASVQRRHRRSAYWIAIQPSDCRADGWWWPQNAPLNFGANGFASINRARLGTDGDQSVGNTFTVGIFEVPPSEQAVFRSSAADDKKLSIPGDCLLLDSVEVRRVNY